MAPSNSNCLIGRKVFIHKAGVVGMIKAVQDGGYLICDNVFKKYRLSQRNEASIIVNGLEAGELKELREYGKKAPGFVKMMAVEVNEQGELTEPDDAAGVVIGSDATGNNTCTVCGSSVRKGGGKEPDADDDAAEETGREREEGEEEQGSEDGEVTGREEGGEGGNPGSSNDGGKLLFTEETFQKLLEESGGDHGTYLMKVRDMTMGRTKEVFSECVSYALRAMSYKQNADLKQLIEETEGTPEVMDKIKKWKASKNDMERFKTVGEAYCEKQKRKFGAANDELIREEENEMKEIEKELEGKASKIVESYYSDVLAGIEEVWGVDEEDTDLCGEERYYKKAKTIILPNVNPTPTKEKREYTANLYSASLKGQLKD